LAEEGDFSKETVHDAWRLRAKFFKLPETDGALLAFLNETGVWNNRRVVHHKSVRHVQEYGYHTELVREIWEYRDRLHCALVKKAAFRESFEAKNSEFPLKFKLTATVVEGVIEAYDTYQALLASVLIDIARGLRFRICARKDCGGLFPLESRHKRKFCSQYCGHLVSIRRARKRQRRTKKSLRDLTPRARILDTEGDPVSC
jgi:hypothetical protein